MRVLLVGNSGSGKSTYAIRLAEAHALARLELDSIVWEPHKIAVARPAEDVRADLDAFLAAHDRWVIEGCDGDLVFAALHACTELLFLNPGVEVCLENNRRRPWERPLRGQEEGAHRSASRGRVTSTESSHPEVT